MEIKNTIEQYNEQRNRHCKTLENIAKDVVEDILQAVVSDIDDLIVDIKTGKVPIMDIAEGLEEIRNKII